MADKTNDIVKAFFEACARDDVEAAVECFADDGKWISAEGDEPGITFLKAEIDDVLRLLNRKRDELVEKKFAIRFSEPNWTLDNKAIVEFSLTDPSGRVLDRGVDIFHTQDGKITVKDGFRKSFESSFCSELMSVPLEGLKWRNSRVRRARSARYW